MKFQSDSPSIYYRISNVVHGGGADIFWNIPLQAVDVSFMLVHCIATLCIVSFCHIWISCSKTKTCLHFLSLYVPVLSVILVNETVKLKSLFKICQIHWKDQ